MVAGSSFSPIFTQKVLCGPHQWWFGFLFFSVFFHYVKSCFVYWFRFVFCCMIKSPPFSCLKNLSNLSNLSMCVCVCVYFGLCTRKNRFTPPLHEKKIQILKVCVQFDNQDESHCNFVFPPEPDGLFMFFFVEKLYGLWSCWNTAKQNGYPSLLSISISR